MSFASNFRGASFLTCDPSAKGKLETCPTLIPRKLIYGSHFTIHRVSSVIITGCVALLAFGGCKRSERASQAVPSTPPAKKQAAGPKLDACSLLTKEEIQAVQGSPITDSKSSEGAGGVFRVSQCYFSAAEANKSVSLSVTQINPDAPGPRGVRDFWKETFGRFSNAEKEEEREKKEGEGKRGGREEEESRPPKKIDGVGEEAFWSGNRVGGALYVLKKENMVRVSVGGPDNEETKINKSKALAEKVISKL